jgi:hypothetical protein
MPSGERLLIRGSGFRLLPGRRLLGSYEGNRRITHFRVSCDFKFPAIINESLVEVALAHFKWDDHFSILATHSGQLQIERINFLGALITHEQGSIVGS